MNEQQIDLFGPIQTSQTYSCTSPYEICEYSLPVLSIDQANQCDLLWQLYEDLISIWQTFEPTIENSVCFWAKLRCCKWPNIEQTC